MTSRLRLAWLVSLLATGPLVVYGLTFRPAERLIDFEVYWRGGAAVSHGRPLYGFVTAHNLPFTYPPVSGLLAVPLSLAPLRIAGGLWLIAALLALAVTVRRLVAVAALPAWWGPVLLAAVGWTEPVRDVFRFGQVGTVLMALVVLDLTRRRDGRYAGVWTGVAAAVKFTPALFIPVLLLGGRRREGWTAAASAAGCTLLAAVVLPGDSRRAWSGAVFDVGRLGAAGGSSNPGNQSVHGALLRAGLPGWVAVPVLALLAVVGLGRARRALADGDELLALALGGALTVAVSPVSWIHHLVWVLPVTAVLVRDRRWAWLALAAAVFWPRTPWLATELLSRGVGLRPLDLLWQDAMGVLAALVVLALRPRSAMEGEHLDQGAGGVAPGVALDGAERRGCARTGEAVDFLHPTAAFEESFTAAFEKVAHGVGRPRLEMIFDDQRRGIPPLARAVGPPDVDVHLRHTEIL